MSATNSFKPPEVVVYDACVLYPFALRDTLISLTKTKKFQARWTSEITVEWTSNLLANNPNLNPQRIERTCELMLKTVPDALVDGYEHIIDTLTLPDFKDRHVLAAAIYCGATKIITENIKDFPEVVLSAYGIEACRPDKFIEELFKNYPAEVLKELRNQRLRLEHPPQSVVEFLAFLSAKSGLRVTASILSNYSELL